ncbi:MAG: hypothetical protein AB7F43_08850 [Bacteriovoracia bacterium]
MKTYLPLTHLALSKKIFATASMRHRMTGYNFEDCFCSFRESFEEIIKSLYLYTGKEFVGPVRFDDYRTFAEDLKAQFDGEDFFDLTRGLFAYFVEPNGYRKGDEIRDRMERLFALIDKDFKSNIGFTVA